MVTTQVRVAGSDDFTRIKLFFHICEKNLDSFSSRKFKPT